MAILSNGELQLNLIQEISGYQKPFVGKYLRHDCKTEKKNFLPSFRPIANVAFKFKRKKISNIFLLTSFKG